MDTGNFDEAYNNLNDKQREAVDSIEGPVLVVAGPGTGKTQILTLRIANILRQTDAAPDSILALTFTDAGVAAMRERLHRYIGVLAYQVGIYTFHSFASSLIKTYPEYYERIIGGRLITDLEKITLLEELLNEPGINNLRPVNKPDFFIKPIRGVIQDLKKDNYRSADLAEILKVQAADLEEMPQYHEKGKYKGKERGDYTKAKKYLERNYELLQIYRGYELALQERNLHDYEDLIMQTVTALETSEEFRLQVQERYQYLLADEHQDVNGAQNRILELLADYHESPNIFVVGDEKQAIYRFQGASLDNFLFFRERYQGTKEIHLESNYRSGPEILDTAYQLLAVEEGPLKALRIPLRAAKETAAVVKCCEFEQLSYEDEWIVNVVKADLTAGIPSAEIAVIVRNNRDVERLSTLLRKYNIPVDASADTDILTHPITVAFEQLLRATVMPSDETLFPVLQSSYLGLNFTDINTLLSSRSFQAPLTKTLTDAEELTRLGISEAGRDHIEAFNNLMETVRRKMLTETPLLVVEYLLQNSGFLQYVLEADPVSGARVVRRLYDEIEALFAANREADLRTVLVNFDRLRFYGLELSSAYLPQNHDGVRITTAHKAKGLEYHTVIVAMATDNIWSKDRVQSDYFKLPLQSKAAALVADAADDDARLFYVAMTRAKKQLFITYAKTNQDGKVLQPTKLLDRISAGLEVERMPLTDLDPLETIKRPQAPLLPDTTFIKNYLQTRGFSATSFNNYRANPWDFLYRNVLKIPEVKSLANLFGTAVHAVLERTVNYYNSEKEFPNDTKIKEWLESELRYLPLSAEDYTRTLKRGLECLYGYLNIMEASPAAGMLPELSLSVVLPIESSVIPDLKLTGKIDRFDIGADGRAVRVYDYKTGKARSRNEIEGKNKNSDGNYKIQLVFYALLLELYGEDRLMTREGVLSFIEPNEKGEIREEAFTTTDDEIATLKTDLVTAVNTLLSGEFLLDEELAAASENYSMLAVPLCRLLKKNLGD